MKKQLPLAFCALLVVDGASGDSDLMTRFIQLVPQGNVSEIVSQIDAAAKDPKGDPMIARIGARFGDPPSEDWESVGNEFFDEIYSVYREYWRLAIRGQFADREQAKKYLFPKIESVLAAHGHEASVLEDIEKQLTAALAQQGLHAQLGVTRPHRDLLVWRDTQEVEYEVVLEETTVNTKVNFMSDFVSKGWMSYTSFGHSMPGGWATEEALFCMAHSYDLESEKFRVSYLTHEARHFQDYKDFPSLEQADLEYRAKLSELSRAESSMLSLIGKFSKYRRPNPEFPHALASYKVVEQLKREIFGDAKPGNPGDWRTIDIVKIQAAARELLKSHTRALREAGAETTRGIFVDPDNDSR